MIRPLAAALVLLSTSGPSQAETGAEAVLGSLRTLGIEVDAAQERAVRADVAAAAGASEYPDWFARSVDLTNDMATLSLEAARPSARVRLAEMHRQLLTRLLAEDSAALALLEAEDPMIHPVEPGVGMTQSDMGWATLLEAMAADLPQDPRAMDIDPDAFAERMAEVDAIFEDGSASKRHFLARVDAWAKGTIAAWTILSPEERQIAVSVVRDPAGPADEILRAVIGTTNVLFWMAGLEVGLTEEERAAYPELSAYLSEGYMAGGVDALLADYIRYSQGAAAAMIGTLNMQMNLNHDLLMGSDPTAGSLMGLE